MQNKVELRTEFAPGKHYSAVSVNWQQQQQQQKEGYCPASAPTQILWTWPAGRAGGVSLSQQLRRRRKQKKHATLPRLVAAIGIAALCPRQLDRPQRPRPAEEERRSRKGEKRKCWGRGWRGNIGQVPLICVHGMWRRVDYLHCMSAAQRVSVFVCVREKESVCVYCVCVSVCVQ